jgi:methylenetetrahydrofolate dehydrogenase (NADP+)/methenyltetrahydrofolate cyclohydrolase
VGAPTAHYLARAGAEVFVATKETSLADRDTHLRQADVVVSGAGVANLVTPDLVKNGVVLIDAGTSNAGRTVVGDIAHECESKAAVFSRTPGGVGPVTVAVLFTNLLRAYTHNV